MINLVNRLVATLWASFAAVTIVLAIVITIVRLTLPQIDEQRGSIEQWLGELTQRPIQIGQVRASWRGWSPTIDVANLVLKNPDSDEELAHFDYALIEIAPLLSLMKFNLVPRRLVVGGMKVALERDIDGQISIAGMPPSRWPVAQWLLEQQNFTLTDAEISFVDAAHPSTTTKFSQVTLSISHNDAGQNVYGTFQRTDRSDEKYAFSLHASGDLLSSVWKGELFVQLNNADAHAAFGLAGWAYNPIERGNLNAMIWTRWEDARLQQAVAQVEAEQVYLSESDAKTPMRLSTEAAAVRLADGWSIDVKQFRINDSDDSLTSGVGIRTRDRQDGSTVVAIQAKEANLGALRTLLPNQIIIPGIELPSFKSMNLRGELRNLSAAVHHGELRAPKFFIEGAVRDLSIDGPRLPLSVEGLDFSIIANAQGGIVRTAQESPVFLRSDTRLAAPIEFSKLAGNLKWTFESGNLKVTTDLLDVRAESIDFSLRGGIDWQRGFSPEVALVGKIESGDLSRFHHLIPKNALRPRGEQWLRNAFQSGKFEPSSLLLRGNLADFPFDEGNGSVKAEFSLRDVDLKYSAQWPQTRSIDATIIVDGRSAVTSILKGVVYSSAVNESTIEMPDLFSRNPLVRVRGKMEIVPKDLTSFIKASPLNNTKAVRYSELEISNPFGMTLDMNLSLVPGGEKEILGLVHFDKNRILSKKQQITLEQFSGDVSFTRQDYYGEGLSALFDGDRVGVVINGGLDDPNYDTEFRMTGTSDVAKLYKNLKQYAPIVHSWLEANGDNSSFTGVLPWKAVLSFPQPSTDGNTAPRRLSFESSLVGLDVGLPWPFSKNKDERKPLVITNEIYTDGKRLTRIDLGSTVDVEIDQFKNTKGDSVTHRAEFIFGERSPKFNNQPGISARGRIDRLPLNDWIVFAKAAQKVMQGPTKNTPTTFDINVDALDALGRSFPDVNLTGSATSSAWEINVASELAQGRITLPRSNSQQRLTLDFDKLWLTPTDSKTPPASVDPKSFPGFDMTCRSLRFGDIDLGETNLVASQTDTGLALETLNFSQDNFNLQGSGDWQLDSGIHRSRINLNVQGETLGGLLKSFGYEVANIDGGVTSIGIAAAWEGMPFEFTLDKLKGSFDLNVEKGRFLDIEPGGGRLFGLLSLQTLPRRISLDFNDLFRKGFTFDSIDGVFELDHGNAYTNSLSMAGPSARISISGRTGLADKDYDQHVTVTPALSNSIPIASALFGPAGIGVGAVIYLGQKMFKSIPEKVDKILSREYSITGNWEQPVIERI